MILKKYDHIIRNWLDPFTPHNTNTHKGWKPRKEPTLKPPVRVQRHPGQGRAVAVLDESGRAEICEFDFQQSAPRILLVLDMAVGQNQSGTFNPFFFVYFKRLLDLH